MREAREKVLFVVTLLLLGGLTYLKLSDRYVSRRPPTARTLESVALASPP